MIRYTVMDMLMASPTEPLPKSKRMSQLLKMYFGLRSIEQEPNPRESDWDSVNTALMMLDALKGMGHVNDPDNLLEDAAEALGKAGMRSLEGKPIRLDGGDIECVRALLSDYSYVMDTLPARVMIAAHRKAEQELFKIVRRGKR